MFKKLGLVPGFFCFFFYKKSEKNLSRTDRLYIHIDIYCPWLIRKEYAPKA